MLANHYKVTVPKKKLNQLIPQMCKVQRHFNNNVEGCIKWLFSQDLKDEGIIYLFVIWESKEVYEKNLGSEYLKTEVFDKLIEYNAAIVFAEQLIVSNYSEVA